jgi:hypothetical protein
MYEVVDNKVGESMQVYCNPEYKSDSEMAPMALKKHKLRVEFLKGHKTFAENYEAIRDFIADSELICFGNVQKKLGTLAEYVEAPFDFAALNKECRRVGKPVFANKATNFNAFAELQGSSADGVMRIYMDGCLIGENAYAEAEVAKWRRRRDKAQEEALKAEAEVAKLRHRRDKALGRARQ